MHYLIDGYNFLYYLSDVKNKDASREEVIELLKSMLEHTQIQITVVFDGSHIFGEESGKQYAGSLIIAFSPQGQSADDFIVEKISNTLHPGSYTVVTSDEGLARSIRSMGSHTKSNSSFYKWISKKTHRKTEERKKEQESDANIERLLKIFENRLKD